jgi:dolichyl-phosphate beta-glucosyltransferase
MRRSCATSNVDVSDAHGSAGPLVSVPFHVNPNNTSQNVGQPSVGPLGAVGSTNVMEPAPRSLTLVVPLFNEVQRLPRFVAELARFVVAQPRPSELILVDDGSDDGTAELIEMLLPTLAPARVRLLRCRHRGKGAAIRAGLELATTEVAGYCDLDLSTPLSDFSKIVSTASRLPILAIGSRRTDGSTFGLRRQSKTRILLGLAYNQAVRLALTPRIVDTQCGAKAAPTRVWRRILPFCREDGFAWDVEAIAIARSLGIEVREIAIEWHHEPGSRIRIARDGGAMLAALPRIRRNVTRALGEKAKDNEGGGVFEEKNAEVLAAAAGNWWFRSKAAFVSTAIGRWRPARDWLVDVGAGAAGVTTMIDWAPGLRLAVEGNYELLHQGAARHAVEAMQAEAAHIPIADDSASVVCLLDVIEHLSDPLSTLREAARILGPDGRLIVTVPAHPRLWSAADVALGHARRYTRTSLRHDVERAGLEVLQITHVFSWLLAPVWVKRRLRPGSEAQLGLETGSPLLTRAALVLTTLEQRLIRHINLPVGTSLLCVARADPDPHPQRTRCSPGCVGEPR